MDIQTNNTPDQKNNSMTKIITAAVIIFAVLLVGFFIFMGDDSDQLTETTTSQMPQTNQQEDNTATSNDRANQQSTDGEQAKNTITYTDDGFTPGTLTVKVGDTVTVINRSSKQLEFSSDVHPTHSDNSEINQTTTAPGESTSFKVSKAGTHGYHDHLNASRTGTLVVEE